jgi:hypothetical protein
MKIQTHTKTASEAPEAPRKYSARQLRKLPTISQGQFSNLKIDDGKHRIWLSRMTKADGMPYNNAIEVEALLDGVWTSVAQYLG